MTLRALTIGPSHYRRIDSTPEYWLEQLRRPTHPRPDWWLTAPEVLEAHRLLFLEYRDHPAPLPPCEGKGVVIAAGGTRYYPSGYALVHALRALGCALPVEVWYLGRREMDFRMQALLEDYPAVRCVDGRHLGLAPHLSGWALKAFAMWHCPFREVLFLDADQMPARDPSHLFDEPGYRDKGAVLWPDYLSDKGVDITEKGFQVFGVPVPGYTRRPDHDKPSDYTPAETGQILVDKGKRARELYTAMRCCEHEDFLYCDPSRREKCLMYGDKSVFLLSFEACGGHHAMPGKAAWSKPHGDAGAFIQHDLAGRHVFSHRVQPHNRKLTLQGPNDRIGVPGEEEVFAGLDKLRGLWDGKVWSPKLSDPARMKAVAGRMVLGEGGAFKTVVLLPNGTAGGHELSHWFVGPVEGRELLVLSTASGARNFLELAPARDCWHNHEAHLAPALPQGWEVREGFDLTVFHSTVRLNEYRLPERMDGWKVLDVGAHFGSFTHACLQRGAAQVLAVEPHRGNCEAFRNHFAGDRRVTLLEAGAWRSDEGVRLAALKGVDGARHLAGGVVAPGPGAVLLLPFDDLLGMLPGPVDLVKLDCESSEYPILFTSKLLGKVRRLCGEYHTSKHFPDADPRWTPEGLRALLEGQGFAVELRPHCEGLGNFWARRP
jgi:FkbM family methyltransferase